MKIRTVKFMKSEDNHGKYIIEYYGLDGKIVFAEHVSSLIKIMKYTILWIFHYYKFDEPDAWMEC